LPRLDTAEFERLTRTLHGDATLGRALSEIEALHRVVFHANPRVDWSLLARSAVQILIAEIVYRHQGRPEGLLAALRAAQNSGSSIAGAAAAIHSYYTTPLGLLMRQELFGADTVFITPDAYDWTALSKGTTRAEGGSVP